MRAWIPWIWSGAAVVLVVSLTLWARRFDVDSLHIPASPQRPEEIKSWKYVAEDSPLPPKFTEAAFLSSHFIDRSRTEFLLVTPGCPDLLKPFQRTEEKLVKLAAIGIGLPNASMSIERDISTDVRNVLYDPTGIRKLTDAERDAITQKENGVWCNGFFPTITIYYQKNRPVTLARHSIVNPGLTQALLTMGTRTSNEQYLSASAEPPTWRGGGLQAVLDLASAEKKWISLKPALGERATDGKQTVAIVDVAEDLTLKSGFAYHNEVPTKVEIRKTALPGDPNRRTGVFVAAYPFGAEGVLEFQIHRKGGQVETKSAHKLAYMGYMLETEAPFAEIERIEVGFPQEYHRVFVDLPPLSGLPTENDTVADLMDQRVPYVQFKVRGAQQYFLERMGGISIADYRRDGYDWSLPVKSRFEEALVRDILEDYLQSIPSGTYVVYHEDERKLQIGRREVRHWDWHALFRRYWPY